MIQLRHAPRFLDRVNECVVGPPDIITALGDPDDHLRLTVLLGHAAMARRPDSADARGCIEEQAWSTKLAHLSRLVDSPDLHGLTLRDIDALWQGDISGPAAWSDSTFRRERHALFEVMSHGAATGRWRLLRPVPRPSVTGALLAAGAQTTLPASDLAPILPEIRPLARALVDRGIIDHFALEDIIEAADALGSDPSGTLISHADELLSGLARDAALRLSLSRTEGRFNGVIGPYTLTEDSPAAHAQVDVHSMPRSAIDELVALGLLHVDDGHARMPRLVRSYYARRAWATGDIDARSEHQWLARRPIPGRESEIERVLERHYHAVEAEDDDIALETSRYYLQDLRQLATRIGRRPGLGNKRKAALVFARITRRDPGDAYAWEYYGYNLAQVEPQAGMIGEAYEMACELDPDNPLYRGRLVGWRGRHGADVVDETCRRVSDYGIETAAASWFAHQVLQGLKRGRHLQQIDRLRRELGTHRVEAWFEKQPARA